MSSGLASAVGGVVKVVAVGFVGLLVLTVGLSAVFDGVREQLNSLNPFASEPVDRTGPSVLQSMRRLQEFHAASGYYETVVDIETGSGNLLPNFIDGERVLYLAKGEVDAVIDFTQLDERSVEVSRDRTAATITLPAPVLATPVLDIEASEFVLEDEALAFGSEGSELAQQAQSEAIEKMTSAAAEGGNLLALAQSSTTQTLEALLGSLGYSDVTVEFEAPA